MKRPTRRDAGVLANAATKIATQIVKGWDPTGEIDTWRDSLLKHNRLSHYYDGYKLARELERDGVDPDSDLVEVLDDALHLHDDAYNEAVELWAKHQNIKPTHNVGDVVTWQSRPEAKQGPITGILDKLAQYVIAPAEDPKFKNGGGYIVNYEDVRPV